MAESFKVEQNRSLEKVADETISALKVVFASTDEGVKQSSSSDPLRQRVLGVAITSALITQALTVQTEGVIEDALFASMVLSEPVFVDSVGSLTQTPPVSGALLQVGQYVGENKILLNIERTIFNI